ncbi:unnamed protein product [Lathyrus oleraceus]
MSCATTFSQLRGNHETKSFKVYLDCLVTDDMHFNSCVDHCETRPFDEILLYSGWLACGSRLNAPHLPEHMDAMIDDYESHLESEEALSTMAESDSIYVDEYIKWCFRISHLYMVQTALGDPPRSAHQEILEEDQT